MVHPLKNLQLQCSMHACFLQQAGTVKGGQSRAVQKVFPSQNIKCELTNEGPVKNPNPFGRTSTGCRTDFHTGLHRQLFLLRVFHFGPDVQGQPISCGSLALLRACHMEKKNEETSGNLQKNRIPSNSHEFRSKLLCQCRPTDPSCWCLSFSTVSSVT